MTIGTHAPLTGPVMRSETRDDTSSDEPGHENAWIAWFNDVSRADVAGVGGKGATPGELGNPGVVPLGFVITADAYLRALDQVDGRGELRFRVAGADVSDPSALARAAKECQALVQSAGMPEAMRHAVLEAYARLGRDVPVTVRVAATADDAAPAPFAAMTERFTNVRGGLELVHRIVECWAWRWSPRVVSYRATRGLTIEPAMAVVIQPMVESREPAVRFSADPLRILHSATAQPARVGRCTVPPHREHRTSWTDWTDEARLAVQLVSPGARRA
jgi:pyruvate,water dikinase